MPPPSVLFVTGRLAEQQLRRVVGGLAGSAGLVPEVAVLGGGVMGSWSSLAPIVIKTVRSRAAMIPIEQIRIVPASLGLNAGITGAGRAILEHLAGTL